MALEILVPALLTFFFFLSLMIMIGSRRKSTTGKVTSRIQGPKPLPIIGNLNLFCVAPEQVLPIFTTLFEQYDGRVHLWMGNNFPVVYLSRSKDVEKVMSSVKFVQKGKLYDLGIQWIGGDGLLTSESTTWKVDRKLMNPSFKYQKFDGFLDTFNKHGSTLVSILARRASQNVEGLDLHQDLAMCTMDSILESAFGVPSNLQNNPNLEVDEAIKAVIESIRVRIFKPWLSIPIIHEIFGRGKQERKAIHTLKAFFLTILIQRNQLAETTELENEKSKPFIDVLRLEQRSDQNIFDHMITIFTGGFETTATGLNYVLYLLALNPEHQDKVHQEVDQVFGNNRDRDITFSDLSKIKYLEMCIKEALRILPSVPFIGRTTESDFELDENLVISEGSELWVSIYHLHRDPCKFPEPEKFDPERFLPDACANRSLYHYVPFAMGSRSCIGQKYATIQMKVLLTCIFRAFSVSTTLKLEDLKPITGLVLEPNVKIPLKLTKRSF